MTSIDRAIESYAQLIDTLAKQPDRHFGGLGDPDFECIRFYTFGEVRGNFSFDRAVELGAKMVDAIENDLMGALPVDRLLEKALLTKLKSVAPVFNRHGKTVFLASWGMGPDEIGWFIRYINDRATFDRYLVEAGIQESEVDIYNDAYA